MTPSLDEDARSRVACELVLGRQADPVELNHARGVSVAVSDRDERQGSRRQERDLDPVRTICAAQDRARHTLYAASRDVHAAKAVRASSCAVKYSAQRR